MRPSGWRGLTAPHRGIVPGCGWGQPPACPHLARSSGLSGSTFAPRLREDPGPQTSALKATKSRFSTACQCSSAAGLATGGRPPKRSPSLLRRPAGFRVVVILLGSELQHRIDQATSDRDEGTRGHRHDEVRQVLRSRLQASTRNQSNLQPTKFGLCLRRSFDVSPARRRRSGAQQRRELLEQLITEKGDALREQARGGIDEMQRYCHGRMVR